jgi:hypothetical protein
LEDAKAKKDQEEAAKKELEAKAAEIKATEKATQDAIKA